MSYIVCMTKVKDLIFKEKDLSMLGEVGVYKIYHINTPEKVYVGSAARDYVCKESQRGFYRRFIEHLRMIKKNIHHSAYLQNAINKHGIGGMRFEILEVCDKDVVIEREQYYIDTLNSCYNMCKIAGNSAGRLHTEEEKQKRSERMKGIPLDEEVYAKMRKSVKQYTKEGVFIKEFSSMLEAAKELDIDRGTISKCVAGKRKTAGGFTWK